MPRRIAGAVALFVFAVCLICGMSAGNSFAETVRRALIAMFATLVIALVAAAMGQRMLNEAARAQEKKSEISETKPGP